MPENDHRLAEPSDVRALSVEQMTALARAIDELFNGDEMKSGKPRRVGFVLMVFPFDEKAGRSNCVTNGADRKDVAMRMREQIKHFEEDKRT